MASTVRLGSTLGRFRCLLHLKEKVRLCSTVTTANPTASPNKEVYPKVEEKSQAEWKWVEHILPNPVVPAPPEHESYPTPSGWVPPRALPGDNPYHVRRTRYQNFPVYVELRDGATRKLSQIRLVDGDIWAFESDLRSYLEEKLDECVFTQVDEVCGKVRVRGLHLDHVSKFLLEKGF